VRVAPLVEMPRLLPPTVILPIHSARPSTRIAADRQTRRNVTTDKPYTATDGTASAKRSSCLLMPRLAHPKMMKTRSSTPIFRTVPHAAQGVGGAFAASASDFDFCSLWSTIPSAVSMAVRRDEFLPARRKSV